jgi:hypothetical protein
MTELTYLFAGVALLAGLISSISVWAPRQLWIKCAAVGAAALFMPTVYLSFAHLLSLPKPVALEWWRDQAGEATVLGATMREEEAIFLWLALPGVAEPRAYQLPWSRDLAEQLQAAQREAESNRSQVQMRLPFEPSLDDREPKFYAMPQPRLPPKDLDPSAPQFYDREAGNNA